LDITGLGITGSDAALMDRRGVSSGHGPTGGGLQSLVEQSYPNPHLRIVVVDDHSTDATLEIATSFAERHPQLHVLRSPALLGRKSSCLLGRRAGGGRRQRRTLSIAMASPTVAERKQ
jgi:hypothetical protein